MAPMAISLFHAQRIERMVTAMLQAECRARSDYLVIYAGHEFGRNIQFPTQFPDICDPRCANDGIAKLDFLRRGKWKRLVRQIIGANRLKQFARIGSHDRNNAHA